MMLLFCPLFQFSGGSLGTPRGLPNGDAKGKLRKTNGEPSGV